MTLTNIEQQEYDRRWQDEKYGALHAGYWKSFIAFIHRVIPDDASGKTILDVGCGVGHLAEYLTDEKSMQVTGIDLSEVALEKSRQRVPRGEFRSHDLTQPMPFEDSTFDYVWCSEVLEHLFSPLFALKEIRRVLKPGGQLMVTVPYHDRLKNVGIALLAFEQHYDPTYPHIQYFTRKSLANLTQQAGLQVQWMGRCGSDRGLRDWIVPTNHLMLAKRAD